MQWPPTYSVRRSRRARSISLLIDPVKGLELVLPYRADIEDAIAFLEKRRSWVEKNAHVLENHKEDPACRYDMPSTLALRALGQCWNLRYHFLPKSRSVALRTLNDRLILTGNITDVKSCVPPIKQWIRRIAEDSLPSQMRAVSEEINLPCQKITVRGQKTLWGSCSPQANISLNYKLLFLPVALAHYVFVHELCHTVHLNHSKRFWNLVARHLPDYERHERELKNADQFIPTWFS